MTQCDYLSVGAANVATHVKRVPLRQCNMAALTHLNKLAYFVEVLVFPLVLLTVPVMLSTAIKGIRNE